MAGVQEVDVARGLFFSHTMLAGRGGRRGGVALRAAGSKGEPFARGALE